jgi:4-amino-4-deoxy-L-arabinose transferase-like glycosyltransferase
LTVRRWAGSGAGLAAGAVLASTPVAVIMFRFDEPDPMLAFLPLAAGYALVHAHYTGTPVGAETVYDLTAPPH